MDSAQVGYSRTMRSTGGQSLCVMMSYVSGGERQELWALVVDLSPTDPYLSGPQFPYL